MSDFNFSCASCGQHLAIDEQDVGVSIKCPGCGAAVIVPRPDLEWNCSKCKGRSKAHSTLSGQKITCLKCNREETVPQKTQGSPPSQDRPIYKMKPTGAVAKQPDAYIKKCPGCGTEVAIDDVLCVRCGWNFKTGGPVTVPQSIRKMVPIKCPNCNAALEVAVKYVGQSLTCASCKGAFQLLYVTMQGVGEDMVVYPDKLEITPRGLLGFASKGLKGTKTIPYHSISGIQFKKPGMITSGYLQFTIPGGNESRGGLFDATSDENTFMFAGNAELATDIKNYIETRIQELRMPQQSTASTSLASEFERLATLRQQGILSEQEFLDAKARLLK